MVARLDGFEAGIVAARELATRDRQDSRRRGRGDGAIDLKRLDAATAERNAAGRTPMDSRLRKGERTLMTGPSGVRQIDAVPRHCRHLAVRRRLDRRPCGRNTDDAAAAAVLPDRIAARGDRIPRPRRAPSPTDRISRCARAVGLPKLASQLDEEAHWNRMLSLGEQQRLGLARALLHAPQYLFLDEATASLDEPSEAALYRLLEAEIAGNHHRLDRPSLDARGLPPAQCRAGPRRRSIRAAGCR